MAFKTVMGKMKPSNFISLSEDGASMPMVFLEEPEMKVGSFDGEERKQAVFPVLTPEGVKVFACSARTLYGIEKNWTEIHRKAVVVTRIGEAGSMHVRYSIEPAEEFADMVVEAGKVTKEAIDKLMKEALTVNKVNAKGSKKRAFLI